VSDLLRRHAERAAGGSRLGAARPGASPGAVGPTQTDFAEETREVVVHERLVEQRRPAAKEAAPTPPPIPSVARRADPNSVSPEQTRARPSVTTAIVPQPAAPPPPDATPARPPVVAPPVAAPTPTSVAPVSAAPVAAPAVAAVLPANPLTREPPAPISPVRHGQPPGEGRPVVTVATPPPDRLPATVREVERVPLQAAPNTAAVQAVERSSGSTGDTQRDATSPPPVHITIGRVDVRASLAASDPAPQAKPPAESRAEKGTLSLADYLAGRGASR
jgi:hypothetical protein